MGTSGSTQGVLVGPGEGELSLSPWCDRVQEAAHGMIPTGAEFLEFNAQNMLNALR